MITLDDVVCCVDNGEIIDHAKKLMQEISIIDFSKVA